MPTPSGGGTIYRAWQVHCAGCHTTGNTGSPTYYPNSQEADGFLRRQGWAKRQDLWFCSRCLQTRNPAPSAVSLYADAGTMHRVWYVSCADCDTSTTFGTHETFPRAGELPGVVRRAGWTRRQGLWVCPRCTLSTQS